MAIAPGVALGISAATAAASTAVSVKAASDQANAVDAVNRRNAENAASIAAANKALAEEEARDRGAALARQSDAYAAFIRTSSEARGTIGSRVSDDLLNAVARRTMLEDNRIDRQLQATKNAIAAGSSPQFIPRGSAVLDAFGGALGGLQTGLGLFASLSNMNAAFNQLDTVKSTPASASPFPWDTPSQSYYGSDPFNSPEFTL